MSVQSRIQVICRFILVAAISCAGMLAVQPVVAADVFWTNAAGGVWSVGSNWSTGVAPGTGDVAIIDLRGCVKRSFIRARGDAASG